MATPMKVLVCSNIPGLFSAIQQSAAAAGIRVLLQQRTAEELKAGGAHAAEWRTSEVLVADPGLVANMLDSASGLRWMQSTWAGVNTIFCNAHRRDFALTRLGGCFGTQMAEYVLGYLLMLERRLLTARDRQISKEWRPDDFKPGNDAGPRPLKSLTLGLLGCGDIGSQIAKAGKTHSMRVVAFRKNLEARDACVDEFTPSISYLLASSDYVVNILPSTPLTRGLLSGDTLRHCVEKGHHRRPPVFINVGRGDVVDEGSLVKALDRSWISAAVLDVFETEPLPLTSPLWTHPKVLITPHISAVSYADDVADLFVQNLVRYHGVGFLEKSMGSEGEQERAEELKGAGEDRRDVSRLLYKIDWARGY